MNRSGWPAWLDGGMMQDLAPQNIFLALLLAFVLGQALAWVYYATHHGLSYSKSFLQSLVLLSVVVAMVMSAIGDNLVMALGLMGALAMIRFRNMIKDTRDIAFISAALVIGMCCGAQRFFTSIIGTAFLGLIALYLYWVDFGAHQPQNGFLRFRLQGELTPDHALNTIFNRFCRTATLISVQGGGVDQPSDYAYQLFLYDASQNEELVQELEALEDVSHLSLTLQESLLEV